MTSTQKAVDAAAFAVAECRRVITGSTTGTLLPSDHMFAEAALTAALAVDGLCLVPKEPTRSMYEAAYAINGGKWTDSEYEPPPKDCWAAMLAAASTGDSPRQTEGK